jgi:hypothetical protein
VRVPDQQEHSLLWALAHGMSLEEVGSNPFFGMSALFRCIQEGWLNGGRLTEAGRLLGTRPFKVNYTIVELCKSTHHTITRGEQVYCRLEKGHESLHIGDNPADPESSLWWE